MTKQRIYTMSVAKVYPHYIAQAEKKRRTKSEVDEKYFISKPAKTTSSRPIL